MKCILNVLRSNIENKNRAKNIFIFFVGLFFLSDFLTKILIVYDNSSFNRLAGVVKLGFEVLMFVFLLKKRKTNDIFILVLILLVAFLVSNINHVINVDYNAIIQNAYYANRYMYIFVFIAFLKLYDVSFSGKDEFIQLFKIVLYINSVLIIAGFLFKIELFRSYVFSLRFGYDGIFSKNGEAAYYYMLFISILYYEYLTSRTNKKLLKIIVISLISILLGKKAILLFLFFLLTLHFVVILKKRKETGLGLLILIGLLVFFREAIASVFLRVFPFWEYGYQNHGFIATITSTRSELFWNFVNYVSSDWKVFNYFFGMGEYEKYMVEFEFVDVFMFFGITGVLVFFYLLKEYFFNNSNIVSRCLLFSILITSFFSGALFLSVTGMLFFYVVFEWINSSKHG